MRYILAFSAAHILLIFAVLALAACGRTGIPTIDNVTNPRQTCALDVALENQGAQPLTLTAFLGQTTEDDDCIGGGYANQEKTVASGSSDRIHLEMQCRSCSMNKSYGVSSVNKTVLYTEKDGSPNIFCSTTSCLGR